MTPEEKAVVGRLPSAGAPVGRVPSRGVPVSPPVEPPPRRLRRLHRVWPDRDGNISYLLTICVEGRTRVLDNEDTFERLVAFLLDSPQRYHWFGRRFVVMPDHIHLIAHMGYDAIRLGQWIKAMKAVVAGLERRDFATVGPVSPPGGVAPSTCAVGPVPSPGVNVGGVLSHGVPSPSPNAGHPSAVGPVPPPGANPFTRIPRAWRWQDGYHDHKFRTKESESRKWEYICLNPVRYHLVQRPEEWPFGGEIFYDEGGPQLVTGTPPLLEVGMLIEEERMPRGGNGTPGKGTRPTN